MIGSIAASILNYKPWAPDYDRLMTMTERQGGPTVNGVDNSWIPLYKPVVHDYEPDHIGREIWLFALALVIAIWGYKNRNHKVERIFARGVLGLALAGAVYLTLTWLARQHVEGDWTAVPPRLIKYEVDTPEYLEKQAAFYAEMEARRLARTGVSLERYEKHMDKIAFLGKFFFAFMIVCFVGAATEPAKKQR